MANNILSSLTAEEIQSASDTAQEFIREFVGRPLAMVAASNAIMLEFLTRHSHFSVDDIIEAAEFIRDFNDKRGDVGYIKTSKMSKDEN